MGQRPSPKFFPKIRTSVAVEGEAPPEPPSPRSMGVPTMHSFPSPVRQTFLSVFLFPPLPVLRDRAGVRGCNLMRQTFLSVSSPQLHLRFASTFDVRRSVFDVPRWTLNVGHWMLNVLPFLASLLFLSLACNRPTPTAPPASHPTILTVASLVPAATDLILGMNAADHLIAVSNWDPDRPEIAHLPRVGDYRTIDWEKLSELHPA